MPAKTSDDLHLTMLAARPSAGLARTLIAQRLTKWGLAHRTDDALLVATELITNAVAAAPGGRLLVRVSRDARGLLIAVWDPSPELPRPSPRMPATLEALDAAPDTFDEGGGWGLPLIRALSTSTGTHLDRARGGKWTWSLLSP
ncbi:ATP-binding protein [Actinocorallia aurea]